MKKKKLPPTGMAARYESAWNQVVANLPDWKRLIVIDEPFGRHADDAAAEAILIAELNAPKSNVYGYNPSGTDETPDNHLDPLL